MYTKKPAVAANCIMQIKKAITDYGKGIMNFFLRRLIDKTSVAMYMAARGFWPRALARVCMHGYARRRTHTEG